MKKMCIGIMVCAFALALVLAFAGCGEKAETVVGEIPVESTIVPVESVPEESGEEISSLGDDNSPEQRFCFEQLNDIEKEIYLTLMKSTRLFVENEEVLCYSYSAERGYDENVSKHAHNAVQAFLADHAVATMWLSSYKFKTGITPVYVDGEYSHLDTIELYMTPSREDGRYADPISAENLETLVAEFEYQAEIFATVLSFQSEA